MKQLRAFVESAWTGSPDRTSLAFLVAANVGVMVGALAMGWKVGHLLVLFWAENVILGVINILKMAWAPGPMPPKFFLIPFFTVHYGGFCAGHGVFILVFTQGMRGPLDFSVSQYRDLWWPFLGLVISHGVSFGQNYFLRGERNSAKLDSLMMAPYKRIVLLHVALVVGGLPVMLLGSPWPLLVLLMIGKTGMDVWLHGKEHQATRSGAVTGQPNSPGRD